MIANIPTAVMAITKMMSAMSTIQSSSPIEIAAKSQSRLFVVYVAVLIAGAVAAALMTVFVYRAGNRYQSAVQADADARIKTADTRAAEARAESDKANAGLAASNVEIARLTAEAEKAKAERAEADKQIQIAKADAARAKEGTANSEVEVARLRIIVANAEQKRAEAELALAEIRRKQAPRQLPVEKFAEVLRERLPEELRLPLSILYQREDAEAYAFASQIASALSRAGFKQLHVDPLPPGAGGPEWLPTVIKLGGNIGLTIVPPDPMHGAPPAEGGPIIEALSNAFAACGFEVNSMGATFFPGGRLTILVGAKP